MIFIFVNGKNVHKTLIILSKLCYCYVYDSLVLVAQWTRARGYEPRCRGFESLLAHFTILNAQVPFVDLVHFLLNSTSRK